MSKRMDLFNFCVEKGVCPAYGLKPHADSRAVFGLGGSLRVSDRGGRELSGHSSGGSRNGGCHSAFRLYSVTAHRE